MGKKRRVWWIVGGVVCFFLLFFVTAILVSWNSAEAKLDRALSKIIAEQKLDSADIEYVHALDQDRFIVEEFFSGRPISEGDQERIIAQLGEACPSCTIDMTKTVLSRLPLTMPVEERTSERYSWFPQGRPGIVDITIVFDDKGFGPENHPPSSSLSISRLEDTRRWSFLKNLWPW